MTSVFTRPRLVFGPSGGKRGIISALDKWEENVSRSLLSFFFFSPVLFICEADLLFIDSHLHFHKFSCSLHSGPPPLAHRLMKILKPQCGSDFFFFQSVLTNRCTNGSYSHFFLPFCSKVLAHVCPPVNLKCGPSSRTQVAFSYVKKRSFDIFSHVAGRCFNRPHTVLNSHIPLCSA